MRIAAESLDFAYPGGRPVFRGLAWTIEPGDLWFLVGPSGSGKTTWLRLCLGLVRPTGGRLTVDGLDMGNARGPELYRLRRKTGVVFQELRLFLHQTAFDNVAVSLRLLGRSGPEVRSRTLEALAAVGLAGFEERPVSTLSYGQQQRVAFARAWVRRPRLLLADEPTGNLDAATAESVLDLVAAMREDGATVIVTTHDRRLLGRLGGKVLELPSSSPVGGDSPAGLPVR
ncbi:MAG: ATP-binding cassette domain-containing protein [Firmicutes bacterium]|nr:ATP-binding cassette domain-containing protein [Alicyclobacillaceae bacterium]MCL6498212.1 ATP-binding cassette domain-containing protein [Bacillota bacterium]